MTQSRTRSRVVTRSIIKAIGYATAGSVAFVAPNTLKSMDKIFRETDRDAANTKRKLYDLKYRRLVEVKYIDGDAHYRLTDVGHKTFRKIRLDELSIAVPKRWDHQWRVVAFDIPTDHNKSRRLLVSHLKSLGFYKLQDSLWVYPFECTEEVAMLIEELYVSKYVTIMIATQGSFTEHVTDHFKKVGLLL